jgi:hypothetical protein
MAAVKESGSLGCSTNETLGKGDVVKYINYLM